MKLESWATVICALEAARDYFSERADIRDFPGGSRAPIPNEEMRLEEQMNEALIAMNPDDDAGQTAPCTHDLDDNDRCKLCGEAREARDRALAQVAQNSGSFIERALAEMSAFRSGTRWTGEAIRETLTARGIVPHHHNAWGAVVRIAIAHGILEATGDYENMKGKKSHARMTQVYRRR